MKISDLMNAMESIAPVQLAEDWDNAGLLIGDPGQALDGPALLTIDLTEAVLSEAQSAGARAVIAYHPPIFHSLKRLTCAQGASASERISLASAAARIAVYSPHTALDAAAGGLTDWLADGVLETSSSPTSGDAGSSGRGGGDRRAIKPAAADSANAQVKIVTFVPTNALETVRAGLASAGAGLIGQYELCSFASPGQGSFRGKPGTRPAVGTPGVLETVVEHRLEMACSRRALALAIETLRQFHPYQEPAIDVYTLVPPPRRAIGVGRRVTLDHPATLYELALRLQRHLGVAGVHIAPAVGADVMTTRMERVGLVPGAGASIAPLALADACQVFVTGEMKHHEVLALTSAGVSVILGGHTATERGYLPTLRQRLVAALPGLDVRVSRADVDPMVLVYAPRA